MTQSTHASRLPRRMPVEALPFRETQPLTQPQSGFTLVELMIALVLGLLISAAAGSLLLSSKQSANVQRASSELQDSGNFGLNYLVTDIRKANFGADHAVVHDSTLYGGLVLSQDNVSHTVEMDVSLMTRGHGQTDWEGLSNSTDYNSDQLTIQYRPKQLRYSDQAFSRMTTLTTAQAAEVVGTDCEGEDITLGEVRDKVMIVQRYFLRKDTQADSSEPNEPLALACDARRYTLIDLEAARNKEPTETLALTDKGSEDGKIILRRVDHFHVLLGVAEGYKTTEYQDMRYMTIHDYMALTDTKPRIVSVQLGVLVRAFGRAAVSDVMAHVPTFNLMDQTISLQNADDVNNRKFIRQGMVQTVALRNGQGADER